MSSRQNLLTLILDSSFNPSPKPRERTTISMIAEVVLARTHKSDEKPDEACDSDDELPIGMLVRALPRNAS